MLLGEIVEHRRTEDLFIAPRDQRTTDYVGGPIRLIDLSARDRTTVDDAVARIVEASGSRLIAVALYGEAASPDYRAGRSPLSLIVLVRRSGPGDPCARSRPVAARLGRRRVPTPLVVDPDYLDRARDVFPLELLEIRDRHRYARPAIPTPSRESRSMRRVSVARSRRRFAARCSTSGKTTLTARSRRRLRADILGSVPYFMHILRGMLLSTSSRAPWRTRRAWSPRTSSASTLSRCRCSHVSSRSTASAGRCPLSEVEDAVRRRISTKRVHCRRVADRL